MAEIKAMAGSHGRIEHELEGEVDVEARQPVQERGQGRHSGCAEHLSRKFTVQTSGFLASAAASYSQRQPYRFQERGPVGA